MSKKPYIVKIAETYERTVVIWEDDEECAENLANDLCAEDDIELTQPDFFESRSLEVLREANERELGYYAQFRREDFFDGEDE